MLTRDQWEMSFPLTVLHIWWLKEVFCRLDSVPVHFQSHLSSIVHIFMLLEPQDMVKSAALSVHSWWVGTVGVKNIPGSHSLS